MTDIVDEVQEVEEVVEGAIDPEQQQQQEVAEADPGPSQEFLDLQAKYDEQAEILKSVQQQFRELTSPQQQQQVQQQPQMPQQQFQQRQMQQQFQQQQPAQQFQQNPAQQFQQQQEQQQQLAFAMTEAISDELGLTGVHVEKLNSFLNKGISQALESHGAAMMEQVINYINDQVPQMSWNLFDSHSYYNDILKGNEHLRSDENKKLIFDVFDQLTMRNPGASLEELWSKVVPYMTNNLGIVPEAAVPEAAPPKPVFASPGKKGQPVQSRPETNDGVDLRRR